MKRPTFPSAPVPCYRPTLRQRISRSRGAVLWLLVVGVALLAAAAVVFP